MIRLSGIDYTVFVAYLLIIVVISIRYRATRFSQMFGEEQKPGWLLLAASLLMIEWSPMTDMMSMGLILDKGYSGLWMLKDRFWLAGVPAILFAPMWARLTFKTDNELIRLRYSGRSAVVLHIFRAVFLGIFVIPFLGAFIILALKKLLEIFYVSDGLGVEMVITIGVFLLVFKNSFHQKLRTDFFNAAICLLAPLLICFFLLNAHGGPAALYENLRICAGERLDLVPSFNSTGDSASFPDFMVFIFIQWWSVYIVDNSDPNAQRHFQAKDQFSAFKALFIPIIITSIMFLFVSTIWDCGILEYSSGAYGAIDKEAFYLHIALKYLPDGIKAIVLIAIMFSFITTLESIINWGGGLLTVDIMKTYIYKKGSDRQYTSLSFALMLLVAGISLLFAFNNDKILTLQKFIFSISAGVAPVFLLRWFWWRINAWTQITAMLSSLVYTVTFNSLYKHSAYFHDIIDAAALALGLSHYPFKLIILTTLVVSTWLIVMYKTQPDRLEHLDNFVQKTGTAGVWPKEVKKQDFQLAKRLFLCVIFAVAYILPYIFIWQFKFGDSTIGFTLLGLFGLLIFYVYRSMSRILAGDKQAETAN